MLTFHLSFTLLITVDAKLLALEIDFPLFSRISSFYDLLTPQQLMAGIDSIKNIQERSFVLRNTPITNHYLKFIIFFNLIII